MNFHERLVQGNYYHIYNQGLNGINIFIETKNYEHFYGLIQKYIKPIAYLYAWVFMPNHFHLLVRIKENLVYRYTETDFPGHPEDFHNLKWQTVELDNHHEINNQKPSNIDSTDIPSCEFNKRPEVYLHFSHLFNAYTRYYNKLFNRKGKLFERSFKRKAIGDKDYLKKVLLYIHNNPVHHGFCEHAMDYPWSSYLNYVSVRSKTLLNDSVMGWFDDEANFRLMHGQKLNIKPIEEWLDME